MLDGLASRPDHPGSDFHTKDMPTTHFYEDKEYKMEMHSIFQLTEYRTV